MPRAPGAGVDATIIKQRHDFLRPDSLVAIIDLTDENDSEIDVRSFGGQGYKFMDQSFQPPRGHVGVRGYPRFEPACTSCAYGGATASDPNCKANGPVHPAAERLRASTSTSATFTCSRSTGSFLSSPSRATSSA